MFLLGVGGNGIIKVEGRRGMISEVELGRLEKFFRLYNFLFFRKVFL